MQAAKSVSDATLPQLNSGGAGTSRRPAQAAENYSGSFPRQPKDPWMRGMALPLTIIVRVALGIRPLPSVVGSR